MDKVHRLGAHGGGGRGSKGKDTFKIPNILFTGTLMDADTGRLHTRAAFGLVGNLSDSLRNNYHHVLPRCSLSVPF